MNKVILLMLCLFMLSGCEQLSIVNSNQIQSVTVDVKTFEIMEGGNLDFEILIHEKPADDRSHYFYYDVIAGGQFIKSGHQLISHNKDYDYTLITESLDVSKFATGKYDLEIKTYISPLGYDVGCTSKDDTLHCSDGTDYYVASYCTYMRAMVEQFKPEYQCEAYDTFIGQNFDSSIQYSEWFKSDNTFTTGTEKKIFCVKTCAETVVEYIETVAVKECSTDADCSVYDAQCLESEEGSFCYKEVDSDVEKITPIYLDTTCAELSFKPGYTCIDDEHGAYYQESGIFSYLLIGGSILVVIFIALGIFAGIIWLINR